MFDVCVLSCSDEKVFKITGDVLNNKKFNIIMTISENFKSKYKAKFGSF
jgi:hypothetical protein